MLLDDEVILKTVRRETIGDGEGNIILATSALFDVVAGTHTVQLGWNTDASQTAYLYANTLDCIELKKQRK